MNKLDIIDWIEHSSSSDIAKLLRKVDINKALDIANDIEMLEYLDNKDTEYYQSTIYDYGLDGDKDINVDYFSVEGERL